MLIDEVLKKVHRKFAKDTDYPVTGSEDLLVMLDHADDAVSEWEDLVKEGYNLKELMTSTPVTLGGTGSDDLPENFLSFIPPFDGESQLMIGSSILTEVKAGEGRALEQQSRSAYVFWSENGSLRTLPAMSGTFTLPYLKTATRFPIGNETTPIEMENPKFMEDFILAKMFLDNADDTLYQSYMAQAGEKLKGMKYNALA